MERPNLKDVRGMLIDGVFASQILDSSAEVVMIDGLDVSSMESGVAPANYEHLSASDGGGKEVVGKVVFVHKIFKESDCETEAERFFYKKNLSKPYLYGIVRLFDAAGSKEAQALAAQIRDYEANKEPCLVGFSIEGSTVSKEGSIIKESIGRKIALTLTPCNKGAMARLLRDPAPPEGFDKIDRTAMAKAEVMQDPFSRKIGGGVQLQYNPIYGSDRDETVERLTKNIATIKILKKALTAGGTDAAPSCLSGGAALQREDVGKRYRGSVLAAARDFDQPWDRAKFKKHLKEYLGKAQLPEISDSFIDHFADVAEAWKLKKSIDDLAKMALIYDSQIEPMTVYRVQNEKGEGPYTGRTQSGGLQSQGVVAKDRGVQPDPDKDFTVSEGDAAAINQKNGSPYLYAFENPDHAAKWFGQTGMKKLNEDGFKVVPVKARKVFRGYSGSQVAFLPFGLSKAEERIGEKKSIDDSLPVVDPDYYMSEGCGIFALALHNRIGGDFKVISNNHGSPWSKGVPYEVTHVVVHRGGKHFDIHGGRDLDEIAKGFGLSSYSVKGPFSRKEFESRFVGNSDEHPLYSGDSQEKKDLDSHILKNSQKYGVVAKSEEDTDLAFLQKKESPVLASPNESVIEDDRTNIPPTPKVLTFRGKKVRPSPAQKSVDLDPKKGILKTPYGSFKLHNPATEAPEIAQHFMNCMNSPHTHKIMSVALSNWHKVHQLNKAGELPEEIPMTATILSTCSGNRPVPLTELQTVRIVDAMRNSGIDVREPGFEHIMPHLRELDKPDVLPVTGREAIKGGPEYFKEDGSLRSINPLLNDTVSNLSEYYKAHRGLVDLVSRHKTDMASAIKELMGHKRMRNNWQDRRNQILKETGNDPGDYKGLNIPGIKLKTGLYAYGMMGGANCIVPDTHFIRHMVGLDVKKDSDTLKYLKHALWEPTNYHVIEKYNDWYRKNHPAFSWMVNHPEFGKYFEKPEDATFPAFWANWINVPAYEEALGTSYKKQAKNAGSTHAPYWAAIEPHVNMALQRLGKSEDFDSTMPLRAALIMQHYVKDFGEIPAQLLYYTHLVPKLLECAKNRQAQSDASSFLRKSILLESELIDLRKSMRNVLNGEESVEMPEIYRVGLQNGTKVNPAGRFMTVQGKLHHLEDYHGILQNMLPEGALNASTISKIHGMMMSPRFEVKEHRVEPEQEMDRQPLIPTVVKLPQPKRDAVFTYYRPGMAKPHTVEFSPHGAALDGHSISSDELALMLENARKGLAAIKWGAVAVLKKHEMDDLMDTDEALQHIRSALGNDHPSVKALTKAIYEDDMVGGIGNKRAATVFRAKGKPGVYASIDANDFKHINDVYGHDAGDDAIKSFGGALREASQKVGTIKIFRTGGDEFAAHAPTFEHMAQFLRHARNHVDALPAIGGTHKQSLSVGLGHNFGKADEAMYMAKAKKLDPVTKQKLYQPGQTPHLGYSLFPENEGELMSTESAPPKLAVE